MIHGAHVILFSKDVDADRAFFKKVLKYRFADAGGGWLIFALPPAEIAFHPSDEPMHQLYLMCDDVDDFIAKMKKHDLKCSTIEEQRWGSVTYLTLPSGASLGVYQPKHASPLDKPTKKGAKKATPKRSAKKKR